MFAGKVTTFNPELSFYDCTTCEPKVCHRKLAKVLLFAIFEFAYAVSVETCLSSTSTLLHQCQALIHQANND